MPKRPTWPWQEPCRGNLPNANKTATLEPEIYDAIDKSQDRGSGAPAWRHVDLCGNQRPASLDENEKTRTPGKISSGMTEDPRQDPCRGRPQPRLGKILAGDTHEIPARALPGASTGPKPSPHLPKLRCPAPVPTWRPAYQLGAHLCGSMRLLGQPAKHMRGGVQIFVQTLPPHQLSSLPAYMALHVALAWTRVEARQSGDGKKGTSTAH